MLFWGGNGYSMQRVGCRGFCAALWLLAVRSLQKKRGVRISPFFSALTGRTPGRVGLAALGLLRHKKGGVDDLGKLRSGAKRNGEILTTLFSVGGGGGEEGEMPHI